MGIADKARTITAVGATGPTLLNLSCSDGKSTDLDLSALLYERAFASLRDPAEFAEVEVGDWGHSLAFGGRAGCGCAMARNGVRDRAWRCARIRRMAFAPCPVAVEGGRCPGRVAPDGRLLLERR
jgi:hypothetical protein